MCSRPFLDVGHMYQHEESKFVPARVLYPYAFRSSEKERIQRSARYIAAMVRQAREFYTGADAAGVTDLSRPVLYFYGALALARAAVAHVQQRPLLVAPSDELHLLATPRSERRHHSSMRPHEEGSVGRHLPSAALTAAAPGLRRSPPVPKRDHPQAEDEDRRKTCRERPVDVEILDGHDDR